MKTVAVAFKVSYHTFSEPTTTPRIELTKSTNSVIINNGKKLNIFFQNIVVSFVLLRCSKFVQLFHHNFFFKYTIVCGTDIHLRYQYFVSLFYTINDIYLRLKITHTLLLSILRVEEVYRYIGSLSFVSNINRLASFSKQCVRRAELSMYPRSYARV